MCDSGSPLSYSFTRLIIESDSLTLYTTLYYTMKKIDFSKLSVRTANCLRAENIEFVEHLTSIEDRILLRIPNMGRRSVEEIRAIYPFREKSAVDIILRLQDSFDVTLYGLNKEFPSLRGIVETLSLTLEQLVENAIEDVEKIERSK